MGKSAFIKELRQSLRLRGYSLSMSVRIYQIVRKTPSFTSFRAGRMSKKYHYTDLLNWAIFSEYTVVFDYLVGQS